MRTQSRRAVGLLAAGLLLTGLGVTASSAATSASLDPGCDPRRPGVVYTRSGIVATPTAARPVPCVVTIPRSTGAKETQLTVTAAGTIVVQADLVMKDGSSEPAKEVAVSTDRGRTWRAVGANVAGESLRQNGIDNHIYRDAATDRVFWSQHAIDLPAETPLGVSDDGGRTWKASALPCCSYAENPHMLAAKPRTSTTTGYPNVLYWCTNTSVLGGIVFPVGERICWKSLDGGTTWGSQFTLLSKPIWVFPECAGRGEMFDALDAYYPSADTAGRLYLPVRCGPTTEYIEGPPTTNPAFLARSDDEGATWKTVADLPPFPKGFGEPAGVAYKEELRVDRLGNLYLVRGTGAPTGLLYLWVSRNGGKTWGPGTVISIPGTHSVETPLWQVAVGEPGRLSVNYAGTQGSSAAMNAYMIETRNALAANPLFRGASLNDPAGEVHVPYALGSEDYTDIAIGPDGVARAAFPRGMVGNLTNLNPATTRARGGGTTVVGGSGGLATTGYPFAVSLLGLALLTSGALLASTRRRRVRAR